MKLRLRTILLLATAAALAGCGGSEPTSVGTDVPAQAPGVDGMKWLKENGYIDDTSRHHSASSSDRKRD